MPLEFKMYSYIGPEPLRVNVPLLPVTRKSTASSSAQSPTPNGFPPPPEFANSYQLDIISALRGNEVDFLSRAAVADAISATPNEEHKLQLIDFMAAEHGAIAVTLENNACKLFECTPGELFIAGQRADDHGPFLGKLVQLFQTTLRKIIPNTFGMLYPLQQFDSTFQIRQIILHYFRDRVILSLLDNFHFERDMFEENPELQANLRQMFLMINLDIRDESDESDCFGLILDDFLGKKQSRDGSFDGRHTKTTTTTMDSGERTYSPVRKIGISIKPTNSRGRPRLHRNRAGRSVANSIESPPPEPDHPPTPILNHPKIPAQRNRKSFSPSPKLFMAKEEAKNGGERGGEEIVRKVRSRTMPSKTVTFWDDETTAYV